MKQFPRMMFLSVLLCLCFLFQAAVAENLYIIPDSDRRALTYEELWDYQYDTLLYAFNEIYARHGYKFETGSRCYNWFTQMPWYQPNMNESSTNHDATYSQCSRLEQENVRLIKQVRSDMRNMGTTNPGGKGLPIPPARSVNKPRGFEFVNLEPGQKNIPVYSAPTDAAYRANNGKAALSTNGAVYALGYENGWMLVLYEANVVNQYRVGYIDTRRVRGALPILNQLVWARTPATVLNNVNVTDDPAMTGRALTILPAGTRVTYLTTMFNATGWDYIETTIDGRIARGFVPSGFLNVESVDPTYGGDG